ncbi:hypothetical protein SAMD00019534_030000 [Acytostelium subglobosum LB1]|uniref:hypothetical protein n=1 Tax=Acytostelium subglobosum LB1 TaxID=1410327 RepID=UPI00064483CE|nr:hypothetical protein SAMD00019534_030000 [Acytostelium subglobosum LB1]GAM19825.1 hypothetical protein SAMD00019534_030000 [Acytostelium subglobosum LB1]|eukprot:XP_012756587.1 hypothetical protein SAMD00019534_030000 [Acytostelium subglobosum LB1]
MIINSKSLLALTLLSIVAISAQRPKSYSLPVPIFDQLPSKNVNFEPDTSQISGLSANMVGSALNPETRIPMLSKNSDLEQARILDAETFETFFALYNEITQFIPYNLTFNLLDEATGIYQSVYNTFYPINHLGWDSGKPATIYHDANGTYQNFHFCFKLNAFFTYQGNEVLTFGATDDSWVFVNNKLVVDLGGIHPFMSSSLNLSSMANLNLAIGNTYPVDFYHCNRHTDVSTMNITTNIGMKCLVYDYCGVCNGDGSSCCIAQETCGDTDACTIDACPPSNLAGVNLYNIKAYCTHTKITCEKQNLADPCHEYACVGGDCVMVGDAHCPEIECQELVGCNVTEGGCQYKPKCVAPDACTDVSCVKGECVRTPKNCTGDDVCQVYFCDREKGCFSNLRNCTPSDPLPECMIAYCEPNVGCATKTLDTEACNCCDPTKTPPCMTATCVNQKCVYEDIDPSDNNPCTVDLCDPKTGVISHDPVKCDGTCQRCIPKSGGCVDIDKMCNNSNLCSIPKCQGGNCTYTPNSCDDGNPCTSDYCDPVKGCYHNQTICPDLGRCLIGICDKEEGCTMIKRNCTASDFCVEYLCDDRLGCVQFPRTCIPANATCQYGVCNSKASACEFFDISPLPEGCQSLSSSSTTSTTATPSSTSTSTSTTTTAASTTTDGSSTTTNGPSTTTTGTTKQSTTTVNPTSTTTTTLSGTTTSGSSTLIVYWVLVATALLACILL